MGSHVIGLKEANAISSMPRVEVREADRRVEPREDGKRAGPRVGARRARPREVARRAEPREAVKRLSSQTGINVSLTGGARGSQTVPTYTPWRIFLSSEGGSSQ